jgi:hypothetical protein
MTITYNGDTAQNEGFWMRWGSKGKSYQVFSSPSVGINQLRYYSGKDAAPTIVGCKGLRIKRRYPPYSTSATIPRSCLAKAPDKLRFQGIATEGTSSIDETKVSKAIARG